MAPDMVSRVALGALPDSPYAAELQRGLPALRFAPPLEAEYRRAYLLRNRTLIRVACVAAALLALLRGAEQAASGGRVVLSLIDVAVVGSSSIALATIAWSAAFEAV